MERVSFDRNIVQYYGACLNEEVPLLVMEYMAVRGGFVMLSGLGQRETHKHSLLVSCSTPDRSSRRRLVA